MSGESYKGYYTGAPTPDEQIAELRAKLADAEARAKKAEENLGCAIDWIKGIPCLGRAGLLEDKNAILSALAQQENLND
jgi:hypothetical protein